MTAAERRGRVAVVLLLSLASFFVGTRVLVPRQAPHSTR